MPSADVTIGANADSYLEMKSRALTPASSMGSAYSNTSSVTTFTETVYLEVFVKDVLLIAVLLYKCGEFAVSDRNVQRMTPWRQASQRPQCAILGVDFEVGVGQFVAFTNIY